MDNVFRTINTLCDDNLIPYYNQLVNAINSCPSTSETRLLRTEAERIKTLIDNLKNNMTAIDMKIAKKYNL